MTNTARKCYVLGAEPLGVPRDAVRELVPVFQRCPGDGNKNKTPGNLSHTPCLLPFGGEMNTVKAVPGDAGKSSRIRVLFRD